MTKYPWHDVPSENPDALRVKHPDDPSLRKGKSIVFDMIQKPAHYNQGGIECIEYLKDNLGEGFSYYVEGNIKKYLHRWRYKGGVEDLKKAQWYLNKLIEEVE